MIAYNLWLMFDEDQRHWLTISQELVNNSYFPGDYGQIVTKIDGIIQPSLEYPRRAKPTNDRRPFGLRRRSVAFPASTLLKRAGT
jgi:hypothetical protein